MARILGLLAAAAIPPTPADAYLYWTSPQLAGAPIVGDEAGIALPLPGATPKEISANLLWTLRAGLNVASTSTPCETTPDLTSSGLHRPVAALRSASPPFRLDEQLLTFCTRKTVPLNVLSWKLSKA